MHYTSDICIIGAGPGGAIASDTLSRSGIRHLLIDRAEFPREKVCADVITRGVIRTLSKKFPGFLPALKREAKIKEIIGSQIYIGNQPIYFNFQTDEFPGLGDCFSVTRGQFDHLLLQEVTRSPYVTLHTGLEVRSVEQHEDHLQLTARNGDIITCKGAIFATGASIPVLQMLGLDRSTLSRAVGIRAYYRNLALPHPHQTYMFVDSRIMPGGLYITPEPDGVYNVNYAVLQDHVVRHSINVQQLVSSFIQEHPVLRNIFRDAVLERPFEGASLFLGFKDQPVSGERFIITGDTASLTDIVTANGIPQAMVSAEMAALFMKECLEDGDLSKERMSRFDPLLHARMRTRLQIGRLAYPLLTSPRLRELLMRTLSKVCSRPNAGKQISLMFNDPRPLRFLFNPLFYFQLLRSRPA